MYAHPRAARERAADLIHRSGYERPRIARGGHPDKAEDARMIEEAVHEHEAHMHPGKKPTRVHFADGGNASGDMAPPRLDRSARKGKGKGHATQVNIAVLSHPPGGAPGADPGMAAMAPHPPMPPAPPGMGGGPPMPMPPPHPPMAGPPPGGMPPGGMPMGGLPPGAGLPPRPPGMREGGRAHRKDGGEAMGKGGVGDPRMRAGAGSGEGRLEKRER